MRCGCVVERDAVLLVGPCGRLPGSSCVIACAGRCRPGFTRDIDECDCLAPLTAGASLASAAAAADGSSLMHVICLLRRTSLRVLF